MFELLLIVQNWLFAPILIFIVTVFGHPRAALAQTDRFNAEIMPCRLRVFADAFETLCPCFREPPFGLAVRTVIVEAVKIISRIECERGEIARVERSALDPAAQPYQDLIDRLFYAMAGLTPEESAGLEERLRTML